MKNLLDNEINIKQKQLNAYLNLVGVNHQHTLYYDIFDDYDIEAVLSLNLPNELKLALIKCVGMLQSLVDAYNTMPHELTYQ